MDPLIIITIAVIAVLAIPAERLIIRTFRREFCVPEGWAGLVYHYGLYVRRNNAGRHIIWGRGWTILLIDLRKALLVISSEDFVLADSVRLRIVSHISYQIADPARAAHETQHWPNELYHSALRALHSTLSDLSYEELLSQRLKIGAQLLAQVQPEAAKIGISILAMDLRYGIFPAEHSCPFTEMLKVRTFLQSSDGFTPSALQAKPVVPEVHEAK
jgi:regulator of protease activity HflC (stomatin/prohibitin superfamily)